VHGGVASYSWRVGAKRLTPTWVSVAVDVVKGGCYRSLPALSAVYYLQCNSFMS
jgi:hypothetical protein